MCFRHTGKCFSMSEETESAKPDPCSEYIHAALPNSKPAPQPKYMLNIILIQKAWKKTQAWTAYTSLHPQLQDTANISSSTCAQLRHISYILLS